MAASHPRLPGLLKDSVPASVREREKLYSSLGIWGDDDTQVSAPIPMFDLVNGLEPRTNRRLKVRDKFRSAEAPCKGPDTERNAQ